MYSRKPFYLIVAALFLVGLALMLHRHFVYEVPWLPGEKRQIWSIEAKVEFEGNGKPVKASLAIPGSQPGFTLMSSIPPLTKPRLHIPRPSPCSRLTCKRKRWPSCPRLRPWMRKCHLWVHTAQPLAR